MVVVTRLGSPQDGTLNENQAEAVRALRAGISALTEQEVSASTY